MPLSDARALASGLSVLPLDARADARALAALADWCQRYSPFTATEGRDGLWLDITGCAHLFGGEKGLLEDLVGRIRALSLSARAAIADTPGAAWAAARHGTEAAAVIPSGHEKQILAGLPVTGLRLEAATVSTLERLGLHRIGDLYGLPRAALARRFTGAVLERLDQALGLVFEPISPRRPPARFRARIAFAEPIGGADDIALSCRRLLEELSGLLAAHARGARRLALSFFRVDGMIERVCVGTCRPMRDPDHLMRLFAERLDRVNPGFGIDAAMIEAVVSEPVLPQQEELVPPERPRACEDLAPLVDKLSNRLGERNVVRLIPREAHVPERAFAARVALDAGAAGSWPASNPRPLRLLARPVPVEVMAPVPDDPPVLFRWRRNTHRVRRADGPERIALEWWRSAAWQGCDPGAVPDLSADIRDYYRVEDSDGRRFWIYREGPYAPDRRVRWFLHGMFA